MATWKDVAWAVILEGPLPTSSRTVPERVACPPVECAALVTSSAATPVAEATPVDAEATPVAEVLVDEDAGNLQGMLAAMEVVPPAEPATPPPRHGESGLSNGSPQPPENTASAERRFKAFVGKVTKPKPAAILPRPSPTKAVTPWQRPLRSRRIAAQSLSRIPVSRRGEYLILKRLGQTSPMSESTAANKFDALFGGSPKDDEPLRVLFHDGRSAGARKRRRRAPRARA